MDFSRQIGSSDSLCGLKRTGSNPGRAWVPAGIANRPRCCKAWLTPPQGVTGLRGLLTDTRQQPADAPYTARYFGSQRLSSREVVGSCGGVQIGMSPEVIPGMQVRALPAALNQPSHGPLAIRKLVNMGTSTSGRVLRSS